MFRRSPPPQPPEDAPQVITCPFCLRPVTEFETVNAVDNSLVSRCPHTDCGSDVPLLYIRDYADFPPLVFSLVGFRSHGKSVFLGSLLHELDKAALYNSPKEWPDFSYSALDQDSMEYVRGMQRQLENRELPSATDQNFFKPAILRMKAVPEFGPCHLLAYDMSGEMLQQVNLLKGCYAGYISRVPTAVLLVTWKQLHEAERSQHHLDELLTIYRQAIVDLGGDSRQQNLVVALTKGDRLLTEPSVPNVVREFLQPTHPVGVHESGTPGHFKKLDEISEEIEAWLEQQFRFGNFVREARDEFQRVEYCVTTATGWEPDENNRLICDIAPRGVLSVLLWALRLQRSGAQDNAQHPRHVEQIREVLETKALVEFFRGRGDDHLRQEALRRLNTGRDRISLGWRLINTFRAAQRV